MNAKRIMLIRHAEKPCGNPAQTGVDVNGSPNPEELTVRGWQRAGALVHFFASRAGAAKPDAIFAAGVGKHSPSLRPQHTVQPLSEFLQLPLNLRHLKGDEQLLVSEVLSTSGTVLISWQHEAIPNITNQIIGNSHTCPQTWPDDRFDLVWILDRSQSGWLLSQMPQLLLPGDREELIPL